MSFFENYNSIMYERQPARSKPLNRRSPEQVAEDAERLSEIERLDPVLYDLLTVPSRYGSLPKAADTLDGRLIAAKSGRDVLERKQIAWNLENNARKLEVDGKHKEALEMRSEAAALQDDARKKNVELWLREVKRLRDAGKHVEAMTLRNETLKLAKMEEAVAKLKAAREFKDASALEEKIRSRSTDALFSMRPDKKPSTKKVHFDEKILGKERPGPAR